MKNKKGLSNVIATVLIILLALAAVVIIWTFIRASIQQTGESSDLLNRCLNSEVEVVSCSGTSVIVKLTRGTADKVKVVIEDPNTGETVVSPSTAIGLVLETANVAVTATSGDIASAAVVYTLADGSDAVCDASPTKVVC